MTPEKCELCDGVGACPDCNAGDECDTCDGTNECPDCGGSGEA